MIRNFLLLVFLLFLGGNEVIVDYFSEHQFVSISLEVEGEERSKLEVNEYLDKNGTTGQILCVSSGLSQPIAYTEHAYIDPFLTGFDIPPEA